MRARKMSVLPSHQRLTTTNWEPSSKLVFLQLPKKLPKNSTSTILQSFGIWSKLERWKKSISGCLTSYPKNKKNQCFEVSFSLILCNNSKPFLDRIVMCNEKCILYDNWQWPAQYLDTEEVQSTSQSQTCTKKRPWSLFGGLLSVWSTTAFWIPVKPLHLRNMLRKLICCSVTQSCLTLCDPMDCSTPGFPVLHHLLDIAETHVHRVSDAIQPCHPLSSPSPLAFNISRHQGLF